MEKFAPGPISQVLLLFFQGFSKIVVFVFFWFYLKFEVVYFGAALLICLRFFFQPLKCCLVKREATKFLFYFSNQIASSISDLEHEAECEKVMTRWVEMLMMGIKGANTHRMVLQIDDRYVDNPICGGASP